MAKKKKTAKKVAKKTAKKPKTKTAKKSAKGKTKPRKPSHRVYDPMNQTGPYNGLTLIEARCQLHSKILKIAEECPEIEATGEMIVNQSDSFKFTIYYDVRVKIDPLLLKYRLTFTPYADAIHKTEIGCDARGWHWINTHFALTDVDTGYQMIVPGAGLGENRFWAVDSANTLALKHALMMALHIKWDNKTALDAMINDMQSAAPVMVAAVIQEMRKFDWFKRNTETKNGSDKRQ